MGIGHCCRQRALGAHDHVSTAKLTKMVIWSQHCSTTTLLTLLCHCPSCQTHTQKRLADLACIAWDRNGVSAPSEKLLEMLHPSRRALLYSRQRFVDNASGEWRKSKDSMVLGNVSRCWTTTASMGKSQEQAAFPDACRSKGHTEQRMEQHRGTTVILC